MHKEIQSINEAKNWQEYYKAYKDIYNLLIETRWAFGNCSFANQLHHAAIPDASGSILDSVSWAIYSQPSPETLEAFLSVFVQLLKKEPHRIRNNRYLFVVPNGPPLSIKKINHILEEVAGKLDFWSLSFDRTLNISGAHSTLSGLNALFSSEKALISDDEFKSFNNKDINGEEFINILRTRFLNEGVFQKSIVPSKLIWPLIDSSFILTSYRLNMSIGKIIQIIGKHAGIAAHIAINRARVSKWSSDAIEYCSTVLEACPLPTEDYLVKPGDILSRIVRNKYEMPFVMVWPLIQAINSNIKDPNFIKSGQKIKLPLFPE